MEGNEVMQKVVVIVAAVGLAICLPSSARAGQRDVLHCEVEFTTFLHTLVADEDSFQGSTPASTCQHVRSDTGFSLGGAPSSIEGLWASASCGEGRIHGQLVLDAHTDSGLIVVEFDLTTSSGVGTGVVSATDNEGGSGSGVMTVHETLSSTTCLPPDIQPTPFTVGPVEGQIGGVGRPYVPTVHAAVTLSLD